MAAGTIQKTCRAGHTHDYAASAAGKPRKCPRCRVSVHVPKTPVITDAPTDAALTALWAAEGPPGEYLLADRASCPIPCPKCGGARVWEGRRTLIYCPECDLLGITSFVADRAAKREAAGAVARTSGGELVTQADADTEALDLAEQRGLLSDRVRRILADERLRADCRHRLEWYPTEINRAATMGRLEELEELLRGERIRRIGFFSLGVDVVEILDAEVVDEWDEDPDEDGGQLAIAAPAVPAVEPAAALTVRGYQAYPDAPPGHCQIKRPNNAGGPRGPWPCGAGARTTWGPLRVCNSCHDTFTRPMPS